MASLAALAFKIASLDALDSTSKSEARQLGSPPSKTQILSCPNTRNILFIVWKQIVNHLLKSEDKWYVSSKLFKKNVCFEYEILELTTKYEQHWRSPFHHRQPARLYSQCLVQKQQQQRLLLMATYVATIYTINKGLSERVTNHGCIIRNTRIKMWNSKEQT